MIAALEARLRVHPNDAEVHYRLGKLLASRASQRSVDHEDRLRAEEHLRRALKLRPDEPRYLATLALVLIKAGRRLDAARVVDRALKVVERSPPAVAPPSSELAWIYALKGAALERRLEDGAHLLSVTALPVTSPECAGGGDLFCLNFTRPESFNAILYAAADRSALVSGLRSEVLDAYRAALVLDPGYLPAARGLLALLHDDADWDGYVSVARHVVEASPDSAWAYLLLGTGLWRSGRAPEAAAAVERGLALLPPEERAVLRDPGRLLRPGDAERVRMGADAPPELGAVYWRKADPLYLTPENERWLEHIARMTYADLRFAVPELGLRGWDTDRGDIYVRYGPPKRIFQVAREAGKEVSRSPMGEAIGLAECINLGYPSVSVGCDVLPVQGHGGITRQVGGRWVFWNYGEEFPNFVFERQLGSRMAKHKFETFSRLLAEHAKRVAPVVDPGPVPIVPLDAQIARFRGRDATHVEIVVAPQQEPGDGEKLTATSHAETGLFLFAAANYRRIAEVRHQGFPRALYTVEVAAGLRYEARLEVLLAEQELAARLHQRTDAQPYAGKRLQVSDLLVARSIEPLTSEPAHRRDFAIRPNPTLTLAPGESLALYYEVYGLPARAGSLVTYRVLLKVADTRDRPVAIRMLRTLGATVGLGKDWATSVEWERTATIRGDRVPDYLIVNPGDLPPGRYRVQLTVSSSGAQSTAERRFAVRSGTEGHDGG